MSANNTQVGGGHYRSSTQHWDLLAHYGPAYYIGNATKYLFRWKRKNGLEDLKKARHYLDKLREELMLRNVAAPALRTVPIPHFARFIAENAVDGDEAEIMALLFYFQSDDDLCSAAIQLDKLIERETIRVADCEADRSKKRGKRRAA